jgi:HSP20 family protein
MLTRWSPSGAWAAPLLGDAFEDWGMLGEMRREMSDLLQSFDRRVGGSGLASAWRGPGLDLRDTGEALEIRAELPGFTHEDIDVQIERATLTVRARRTVDEPEGYIAHRRERGAMEVARAFTLPYRVDPAKASATLRDGVLELRLPKSPEEQPRRLTVQVS